LPILLSAEWRRMDRVPRRRGNGELTAEVTRLVMKDVG